MAERRSLGRVAELGSYCDSSPVVGKRPVVACRAAVYSLLVRALGSEDERQDEERSLKATCEYRQWCGAPLSVDVRLVNGEFRCAIHAADLAGGHPLILRRPKTI